jgi:hypothetical protein
MSEPNHSEPVDPDSTEDDCAGGESRPQGCLENILQRLFVALFSLLLLTISTGGIQAFWLPPPQQLAWRIVYHLFIEFCFVMFVVSVLGFIWTIAKPRWVEKIFETLFSKFLFLAAVLIFGGLFVAFLFP